MAQWFVCMVFETEGTKKVDEFINLHQSAGKNLVTFACKTSLSLFPDMSLALHMFRIWPPDTAEVEVMKLNDNDSLTSQT